MSKYCYNVIERPKLRLESPSKKTVVPLIKAKKMSESIAQMVLSGNLIQASALGYDYMTDKDLPENFDNFRKRKSLDIVDLMDINNYVSDKIKEYKTKVRDEKIKEEEEKIKIYNEKIIKEYEENKNLTKKVEE